MKPAQKTQLVGKAGSSFLALGGVQGVTKSNQENQTFDDLDEDYNQSIDYNSPEPHRVSTECVPAARVAHLKTNGYFEQREDQQVLATPSLLDNSKEEALALEVGRNASWYLEECFHKEGLVLDRDKFNAIPEVTKSDLTITGCLGKGTFSDVFKAVYKSGKVSHNKTRNSTHCDLLSTSCFDELEDPTLGIGQSTTHRLSSDNCVLAMKCLRPQVRLNSETFHIGAEDLVHEAAILANLNHRHIIKLYGRASGPLTDAFMLNDSYFILLDKLTETLQDRINAWKQTQCIIQGPQAKQLEVAHSIADATMYLHSKNVIFRNLKPQNVGFDSRGVVKLFDFGFAIGTPSSGFLYDKAGTPRYMAPEVGLSLGYGIKSDVYSFGILLWEISALETPFSAITSSHVFNKVVFMEEKRPALGAFWSDCMKELICSCWSTSPGERPTMLNVKSSLRLALGTINSGNGFRYRVPETKKREGTERLG